jgi:hypothetical protein
LQPKQDLEEEEEGGGGGEKLLINAYLWNYRLMLPFSWLTD